MIVRRVADVKIASAKASEMPPEVAEEEEVEVTSDAGVRDEAEQREIVASFDTLGRIDKLRIAINSDGTNEGEANAGAILASLESAATYNKQFVPSYQTNALTGAVLGAVGGLGVAMVLEQTGKVALQHGNPIVSAFGIGCALAGVALGTGAGIGIVELKANVTAKGVNVVGTAAR